jgi:hypothetical protein
MEQILDFIHQLLNTLKIGALRNITKMILTPANQIPQLLLHWTELTAP